MKNYRNYLFLFLPALLLISGNVFAQIPSGYYDSASGLTGSSLKAALHDIIDGHTTYPYTSSLTDTWDILKEADRDPNDATKVIGLYSGFSMDAAAEYNSGDGWSREHVWAKSRGDFGTSQGAGTDCHHLRAEDVSTNSARNNRNFDNATTQYCDASGTYSGCTDSKTSSSEWVWEPRDEVKGDVARMIFYMVVRYEGDGSEPDLELVDYLLTNTDNSPYHGMASTLVEWHENDPVSSAETTRNDVIYSYQGNRNPFIDHPEYVCEIFSSYCSGSGTGGTNDDLFFSEYIEGSSYNKALEIANETGSSVSLSNYSLKKQTNGAGSWADEYALSGTLADGEVFVIAHSSADASITAVADVTTTSGIVTYNGNDPIGLFKNDTLIDIIGTFDGGSSNFAQNVTKVRISSISGPNSTYTTTEWTNYSEDTFDYIGVREGIYSGGSGTSGGGALIISEYIEGSSNNKALEIANVTGASINMSGYSLKKETNGSGTWADEYTLSGTLADGEVFVIANSSASSSITSVADVTTTSGIVTFNGNDAVGLFRNDTLMDMLGTFNSSTNYAQNVTKVRNANISTPNSTYTTSEWTNYSSDTFGYLGSHTSSSKTSVGIAEEVAAKAVVLFPNPVDQTLNWNGGTMESLEIYDQLGKKVLQTKNVSSSVDLTELSSGIYFVKTTIDGNVSMQKIVKK